MINDELIRAAIYSLLNGNVIHDGNPVPVADGFQVAEDLVENHIIIGDVRGSQINPQGAFIDDVTITLDTVTYQHNGWERTTASEIDQLALDLLITGPETHNLAAAGLQITNVRRESYGYLTEESDNGNIVRKQFIISLTAVKQ